MKQMEEQNSFKKTFDFEIQEIICHKPAWLTLQYWTLSQQTISTWLRTHCFFPCSSALSLLFIYCVNLRDPQLLRDSFFASLSSTLLLLRQNYWKNSCLSLRPHYQLLFWQSKCHICQHPVQWLWNTCLIKVIYILWNYYFWSSNTHHWFKASNLLGKYITFLCLTKNKHSSGIVNLKINLPDWFHKSLISIFFNFYKIKISHVY